jgi:DNA-binding NtrC family response regulator
MKALMSLSWNGNVRELDNVLERAMILGNGEWIEAEDLPRLDSTEQRTQSAVGHNLQDALSAYEKTHIENVLREVSNDRTRAAELLGMSRSSLYRKMERLRIASTRQNTIDAPPHDA